MLSKVGEKICNLELNALPHLMVELRNLEKEYPEYQSKESLTQKVGGTVKEGFTKESARWQLVCVYS